MTCSSQIGIMVMTHGDDRGRVLPPRVAPTQAVIVPILFKDKDNNALLTAAHALQQQLKQADVRTHVDDRTLHSPGFKFNHWELKGMLSLPLLLLLCLLLQ